MNSRLHLLAALMSAVVLTAGVSACSSDEGKSSDGKPSSGASSTSSAKSAPASAEQIALLTAIAETQASAGSTHVVMTMGSAAQQIKAYGDLALGATGSSPDMSVNVEMAGNKDYSLSMIMLDRELFLNLGQTTGNKYGKVGLDAKEDESVAIQFTPLAEQLDPVQQITRLSTALTSIVKLDESEEIDGVETAPYEIVLETKKIPGMEEQPADAPKTVTYTLFVGPDQLVRRVTTGAKESVVQTDYTRWGEPVTIKAPKSSQISDTALDPLRGGS